MFAHWERDLTADLGVVRKFDAGALVSLVQEEEIKALGVPTLGQEAEALGLEWHHLPITDMGVPDETFEMRWTYEGHRLRRRLARRESLVLLCRARNAACWTTAQGIICHPVAWAAECACPVQ